MSEFCYVFSRIRFSFIVWGLVCTSTKRTQREEGKKINSFFLHHRIIQTSVVLAKWICRALYSKEEKEEKKALPIVKRDKLGDC